jgi:uncharacterized protein YggE
MRSLLMAGMVALVPMIPAAFAGATDPPISTIQVSASAVVSAKPDRAEVDIGVVTQAAQSREAAASNASQSNAVLAALRKVLPEHADIRTVSYALTPNYRYQNGSEPTLTGYTATNLVRVTVDDLDKVGVVLDAASQSGANRIQDIRFILRDPQSVRLSALREAAAKARTEAETLAGALGVRVVRVMSVESDDSSNRVPVRHIMMSAARAQSAVEPTPVEAGTLDVSADVKLTVEIGAQKTETP